jgi:hypothetical protein
MLAARGADKGTALIAVLMVTTLLAALSAAVVLIVMTDSMASANHGAAQQALYAADAALEQTMSELRVADWSTAPGGVRSAYLRDGALSPAAPDGTVLDLARLAVERQRESDRIFGASVNRPVWRLFGHAPFSDLTPAGVIVPPAYLLIWMADDGDEGDGDPERDSNGVLMLRVEAFGSSGAHRSVEATVSLQTSLSARGVARREVRVLSWREVR